MLFIGRENLKLAKNFSVFITRTCHYRRSGFTGALILRNIPRPGETLNYGPGLFYIEPVSTALVDVPGFEEALDFRANLHLGFPSSPGEYPTHPCKGLAFGFSSSALCATVVLSITCVGLWKTSPSVLFLSCPLHETPQASRAGQLISPRTHH